MAANNDLLEQYKLAAELADRVSARRGNANLFFLSIQSTLLTASGIIYTTTNHVDWYALVITALMSIFLSLVWWRQLQSYRLLNRAKFEVINFMEEGLPVRIFADEWEILKKRTPSYVELGASERVVPWVFAVLQFLLLVGRLVG